MKTRSCRHPEITPQGQCTFCAQIVLEPVQPMERSDDGAKRHTPTPWRVESDKEYDRVYGYTARGSFCVATCNDSNDAHLIVRAVNAHEDLLEALKAAYTFFNTEANTPDKDGYTVAPDSLVRVVLRKMNQAIAKAEGL